MESLFVVTDRFRGKLDTATFRVSLRRTGRPGRHAGRFLLQQIAAPMEGSLSKTKMWNKGGFPCRSAARCRRNPLTSDIPPGCSGQCIAEFGNTLPKKSADSAAGWILLPSNRPFPCFLCRRTTSLFRAEQCSAAEASLGFVRSRSALNSLCFIRICLRHPFQLRSRTPKEIEVQISADFVQEPDCF